MISGTPPRLAFIDKETDSENGLADFSARKFDPGTACFSTTDPLWEHYRSTSPYLYAADNPVRVKDPSGLGGIQREQDVVPITESAASGGGGSLDNVGPQNGADLGIGDPSMNRATEELRQGGVNDELVGSDETAGESGGTTASAPETTPEVAK